MLSRELAGQRSISKAKDTKAVSAYSHRVAANPTNTTAAKAAADICLFGEEAPLLRGKALEGVWLGVATGIPLG